MLISALLVLSSFAALAAAPVLDSSVSVTGLDAGDVVHFYKVLEWDQSSGWKYTTDFADLATAGLNNNVVIGATESDPDDIKDNVLEYIAGIPGTYTVTYGENGAVTQAHTDAILGRINSELAAVIATTAREKTEAQSLTVAADTTSVTWNATTGTGGKAPEAGLYVALVTPATAGTVYNPIFVSADYDSVNTAGHANTQEATLSESYSDTAMAKKTTIDVKKTIIEDPEMAHISEGTTGEGGTATSVDAGETLQFKVVTTIPEYNSTYTTAAFKITDTLTGLALVIDDNHPFLIKAAGAAISDKTGKSNAATATFSNSAATGGTSYAVDFTPAYILGLDAETPIEITYYAKITDQATKVVNPTDNTVKVEFSNNPNNLTDKGTLIDRTNQYSFSIDASINGKEGKTSSELIKVGVDKEL